MFKRLSFGESSPGSSGGVSPGSGGGSIKTIGDETEASSCAEIKPPVQEPEPTQPQPIAQPQLALLKVKEFRTGFAFS